MRSTRVLACARPPDCVKFTRRQSLLASKEWILAREFFPRNLAQFTAISLGRPPARQAVLRSLGEGGNVTHPHITPFDVNSPFHIQYFINSIFNASAQGAHGRDGGKAALARAHSKTCRNYGGSLVREASWSAERSSALAPKQPFSCEWNNFVSNPNAFD